MFGVDYGARMFLTRGFPILMGVDPLGYKTPSISVFAYCFNNPVMFIDPTGMEVEPSSRKQWDREKGSIEGKLGRLEDRAAKGRGGDGIGERISSLSSTLSTMATMEASEQVYALGGLTPEGDGGLTYDGGTGIITVGYEGTANFVHEIAHGGQFEAGEVGFNSGSNGGTVGQDVYDEVSAYSAQYAYDPASVSGLTSSSSVRSSSGITPSWVQGITKPDGSMPYAPGGSAKTGTHPVNINSTGAALRRAYPGWPANNPNLPLKSYSGVYSKK